MGGVRPKIPTELGARNQKKTLPINKYPKIKCQISQSSQPSFLSCFWEGNSSAVME